MADEHSITPDERAMLGEDVENTDDQAQQADPAPSPAATLAAAPTPAPVPAPAPADGNDLAAAAAAATAAAADEDDDFEKAKQEIDDMDDPHEAEALDGLQQIISEQANAGVNTTAAVDSSASPDESSVYVGQVDYEATPDELQSHFEACGTINRVTILCDKFTGRPKGYAYIEFADKEGAENALALDSSPFKGRNLKVTPKRTNVPGMSARGGRGRGRGRGGYYMEQPYRGRGYRGRGGYRGGYRGGFRGGYRGGYHPYSAY